MALVQGVRVMDERRYILEPLLHDEDVHTILADKLGNTCGAHAYNHLVPLFAQDLVRDLARLYLDEDRRVGSFVNLYRKASDPGINALLREQFRCIPDKWHNAPEPIDGLTAEQSEKLRNEWRDKGREDFAVSFDEGWEAVTSAIEAISNDAVAEKIKTFRDKYHAHLEMTPLGSDPGPFDVGQLGLTYSEILEFESYYMPAAFELVRVLTGNVYDVEGFSNMHRKYGESMWRVLAGLPETMGS